MRTVNFIGIFDGPDYISYLHLNRFFVRLLEPLDDSVLKELSDYYREFSGKKYKVLTPFPGAPLDEFVVSTPSISWPGKSLIRASLEFLVRL